MRNIKLTIEYVGAAFCGWQIQNNARSVQGVIRDAIRNITKEENNLIGASRTDAGVHALGQVAHFKTSTKISLDGFVKAINSKAGKNIAVIKAEEAGDLFHAQRSAKSKLYRYILSLSDIYSPHLVDRCWFVRAKLNLPLMRETAKLIKGEHDFKMFQASGSSTKTTVREIYNIKVQKADKIFFPWLGADGAGRDDLLYIDIKGNGFLYKMVRNIVGTLVEIGKGRVDPKHISSLLNLSVNKRAGVCAPAQGLYLVRVDY